MNREKKHTKSRSKGVQSILTGLVVLCLLPVVTFADASAGELFVDPQIPHDLYQAQADPVVIRSRPAWVDIEMLDGVGVPSVVLNLFDGVSYPAIKERIERRGLDNYTWFGYVDGFARSQATFVVGGDDVVANIAVDGKFYQVRPTGDGLHAIREIDQSAFPDEIPPIPVDAPGDRLLDIPVAEQDDGSTIDVMVVYTPAAAAASSNINAEIQLAVDETNTSYSNSGVTQRLNLVHTAQVAYIENPDMGTDLSRLRGTSDGYMDNIHGLRNTYGADTVTLIVEGANYCGIAYLMTSVSLGFESSAFSVVARDCATGYYSFGHELGHNMGARHDWYVDSAINSPYSYNKGFVNTTDRWRTIMAYNSECSDSGFNCSRLQYWSNPDFTFGGDPMGVPEGVPYAADNRKTLNNTATTVGNFRQSVVANPLTSINLMSPAVFATPFSRPTFIWTADGGANNAFAVDFSQSVSGPYWSTYENMGILVTNTSWTMPRNVWNQVPTGYIYWKVRGADRNESPLNIISSDEIFWFYKY
jgi:hypothetical protein